MDLNGSDDSSRKFLRGSNANTAGSTGGSKEHSHNANANNKGDGNGSPRWGNANTDIQNHIPPYFDIVYLIRVK